MLCGAVACTLPLLARMLSRSALVLDLRVQTIPEARYLEPQFLHAATLLLMKCYRPKVPPTSSLLSLPLRRAHTCRLLQLSRMLFLNYSHASRAAASFLKKAVLGSIVLSSVGGGLTLYFASESEPFRNELRISAPFLAPILDFLTPPVPVAAKVCCV